MKFPFSNSSMDELRPLKELQSPLSTSAIRERVLERMAFPSLWGQLRNILAEVLVVGVAGAVVFQLARPVAERNVHPRNYQSNWTYQSDKSDRTTEMAMAAHAIGSSKRTVPFPEGDSAISPDVSNSLVATPVAINNNTEISRSFASHPSSFILQPSSLTLPPSSAWFASASGGAIFSHLRMLGERGEVGFEDGWKTIALSYTNSDGSRDLRDVIAHHTGFTAPLLSKERNQEFSLLLGATTPVGPFEFRVLAGPAYLSFTSAYFNPATGTTASPASLQGFGAAAEVSALYQWNGSVEIALEGTANYWPRQFSSGLFASLEYRLGS